MRIASQKIYAKLYLRDERISEIHPSLTKQPLTKEDYMANLNIHASPDFLNELDWQLRRLSLLIASLEGLTVSLRDLDEVLSLLLREARMHR